MSNVTIRLRVLRVEKQWNQRQVAKKLGIGLDRYWKIENGHTEAEPKEREKLAAIYGVTEEHIFGEVESVKATVLANGHGNKGAFIRKEERRKASMPVERDRRAS